VRRVYGVLEAQFRRYFAEASRLKGVTGENLLRLLELRLDNVVYSLGFASSRSQARQLVRHGHVQVNGGPQRAVVPGEAKHGDHPQGRDAREHPGQRGARHRSGPWRAPWLELDAEGYRGKVLSLPSREDIRLPIQEQLIVELYSR